MLFRTKFVAAFAALTLVAVGSAGLLFLSAKRSDLHQVRTSLAYESLSGYLELSGEIFRTFKQSRRDLISGTGAFAFDMPKARQTIDEVLASIERVSHAEAGFVARGSDFNSVAHVRSLGREISVALDAIENASELILTGQIDEGRRQAISVLEGQVDDRIATLIEDAIVFEKGQLQAAQAEVAKFHLWVQRIAWIAVSIAILLSTMVLLTLVRRLRQSLVALEIGAREYATGNLNHKITLDGQDELASVARRFSDMSVQLLNKRNDLERVQQDLEDRVRARTQELSEVNDELRARDSLRRQFFADIGHELRTPVTAIRGEAEVALRAQTNQQTAFQDALTTIVSLSEQLTESVNDLFLIAREQAGVLDFRHGLVDLADAAGRAVKQMQSLAADKDAGISTSNCPQPVTIEGDGNRIAQLVRILISNSLAHAQKGVRINLSIETDGENAILTLADNGPGIDEKDRKRIFDRYVTGQSDRKRPVSGTGLGLAIAKAITQAHGGRITAEAIATGGARFVARFPLPATDLAL